MQALGIKTRERMNSLKHQMHVSSKLIKMELWRNTHFVFVMNDSGL